MVSPRRHKREVGKGGRTGLGRFISETATDRDLLDRVGEGDECALAELYARYAPVVFSFVLARTSDHGVAEEVSADVWLGCWRSAGAFRGDSRVLTWLLGIAKRQVWTHTRGKRLPIVPLAENVESIPPATDDPAELAGSAVAVETLVAALGSLPSELSEVVRLAWLYELPYDEIASVVGIPVGTVKSRVSRARRMMREVLRKQDV